MGNLYQDKEKEKKNEPVFNVTASRNTEVEEELERRRRKQEEQRRWMENDPARSQGMMQQNRVLPSREAAETELKKDYVKITEPVVPWEEFRYPDMSKELQDLMKETLNDSGRYPDPYYGVVKDAAQALAVAGSPEMKDFCLERMIRETRAYLDASSQAALQLRIDRCTRLFKQLTEYKLHLQSEREAIEKKNASKDKDARAILHYEEAIEDIKNEAVKPYPEDGDESGIEEYRKSVNAMGKLLSRHYVKLIGACEMYLLKKNKSLLGRKHYEAVQKRAETELENLDSVVNELLNADNKEEGITWGDAIRRKEKWDV